MSKTKEKHVGNAESMGREKEKSKDRTLLTPEPGQQIDLETAAE